MLKIPDAKLRHYLLQQETDERGVEAIFGGKIGEFCISHALLLLSFIISVCSEAECLDIIKSLY